MCVFRSQELYDLVLIFSSDFFVRRYTFYSVTSFTHKDGVGH